MAGVERVFVKLVRGPLLHIGLHKMPFIHVRHCVILSIIIWDSIAWRGIATHSVALHPS